MQPSSKRIDPKPVLLLLLITASAIVFSGVIAFGSNQMAFGLTLALGVCILVFAKPELALYLLVFSMLLSPEFGQRTAGGAGGSGVTIRLDDILLVLIGFSWFVRTAIDKNLSLFLPTKLNRPILFYMIACVTSTAIGVFLGNVSPLRGFFYILKYFEYYVVYFLLVNLLKNRRQMQHLVIALLLTCFIIDIVGLVQIPSGQRITAPFEGKNGEPNTLGGYLVLMISLSLALALQLESLKLKLLLWPLSGLSFIVLLFTQSRGSYLAFVVMFISLILLSRKKILVLLLVMSVGIAPFVIPEVVLNRIAYTFTQPVHTQQTQIGGVRLDTSTSARLHGWKSGFDAFLKRPLFGYGVTGFGFLDAQYLVVLVDTGIVGLFFFLALLWVLLKESWINYRSAYDKFYKAITLGFISGFIGILFHAISANSFIIVRVMEPFWFLAGLVVMCPAIEKSDAFTEESLA